MSRLSQGPGVARGPVLPTATPQCGPEPRAVPRAWPDPGRGRQAVLVGGPGSGPRAPCVGRVVTFMKMVAADTSCSIHQGAS